MKSITTSFLNSLKPSERDQFIRDSKLQGFGVKVTPSGRISFFAEARVRGGPTRRKTLGQHPATPLSDARERAMEFLRKAQAGIDPVKAARAEKAKQEALSKNVWEIFSSYLEARPLAPKTLNDYQSTFRLIFLPWAKLPIRSVTRAEVEKLFHETSKNRGMASANKASRMMSAVFNFAMADDVDGERLIAENPFDVLKQKKLKRALKPREHFLPAQDVNTLIMFFHDQIDWGGKATNGVTPQGINYIMLLLSTGLRRSEGASLRWEDVDWQSKTFVVRDTKNGTNHHVPMSTLTEWVLKKQLKVAESSRWVFPSNSASGHIEEPKSQIAAITKATGIKFTPHDLRRTFATHAEANGAEFELIRKALNHKSGGTITSKYIIRQVETLRPVFEAVSDAYHTAYDPDWKTDRLAEQAELEHYTKERVEDPEAEALFRSDESRPA